MDDTLDTIIMLGAVVVITYAAFEMLPDVEVDYSNATGAVANKKAPVPVVKPATPKSGGIGDILNDYYNRLRHIFH